MNETTPFSKSIMKRFYLVAAGLFLFALGLIGKLVYVQFVLGEKYNQIAIDQIVKNVVLEPSRGNIYASDGNILATSIPRYELRWDAVVVSPSDFEANKAALSQGLADILGKERASILQELERARRNKSRYWLVGKNLTFSEYKKIKALPLFNKSAYRGGLIVEQQIVRAHPLGKIAERTIGYEKKDTDGTYFRVGLEGAYSQYLRGESGLRLKQRIANGQWKPINDNNEKEPTEGFDLHTTIDVNYQDFAHNALLQQLEKFDADHGSVVLMEVKTGDVKAIANLGRTSDGKYFEKLNYALGESHEPGSTFKLMGMIALLEDNYIDENTAVNTGNGEIKFYGKYKVKDSHRGGYGIVTAAKAFEVSSNVGMVRLITDHYGKNPEQFIDRLYNMGLNKPLEMPILGEGLPKIPYPTDSDWDGLDLPWMAYGYGVSFTPLQLLTFYNAVANDGVMVKPRLLKQISNLGNLPTKRFSVEVINPSICSKPTLEKVQKMMFNVVDKKWGTGHGIKDPLLKMAGKTGTCQVDYTKDEVQYVSSFVGYFPADAPKYSCMVVVHRPNKQKGYYGATVAAPVFKTIAKKIYNSLPQEVHLNNAAILSTLEKDASMAGDESVPNVTGMEPESAVELLDAMGWEVQLKGNGKVVRQSIKPGKTATSKKTILLELS